MGWLFNKRPEQDVSIREAFKTEGGQRDPFLTSGLVKLGYKTTEAKARLLSSRVSAVQTGMGLINWLKPMLFIALGLFFIIGPGVAAFGAIFKAMTWYYWVLAIFIVLWIWRSWGS